MILIPALLLAIFSAFNLNAQSASNTTSNAPAFQDFLSQFPKATLPYTFSTDEMKAQVEKPAATRAKRLAWEFYQFLPELERSAQYSNMPVYPEPVASFETDQYFAVLYNIARGIGKGVKTYSITVYDKQGNYIGTNFVAGYNSKSITAATIDASLQAKVTEFEVNWEMNYLENGAEGNRIIDLKTKGSQTLDLTAPGNPDQLEWSAAPMQKDNSAMATADTK